MAERFSDDVEDISFDVYERILSKLNKKETNRYEFVTKAGLSLHLAIFNLFRTVWKNECIPPSWRDTVLVQLSKG